MHSSLNISMARDDLSSPNDYSEDHPGDPDRSASPVLNDESDMEKQGQAAIGPIIKRLWAFMAPHRALVSLAIISAILAALLSLSPYLAMAAIMVELAQDVRDWDWMLTIGLMALAGVAAEKCFFGLSTYASHRAAFATQKELRFRLAQKLARLPLGFTEQKSKGDLRSTLIDDIEILEDGMAHLVPDLSSAVIAPLITIVITLFLDWRLALLLLLPVMLGVWMLSRMMKKGDASARKYIATQVKMSEVTAEIADGMAMVRAFNQQEQASKRSRDLFARTRIVTREWLEQSVSAGASAQVMLSNHLLFVGPIGLLMAVYGYVSPAMLAGFLAVAYGFGDIFASINGLSHRMMQQTQLLARIDDILNSDSMPVADEPQAPLDGSIAFEGVNFSYDNADAGTDARMVLRDISLDVRPGQCLALVGPSGCGKSTLIKLAARFHDVDAGMVRVGQSDVRDLLPDILHRHISSVFQDVFLFSGTIAENIRLGKENASQDEIIEAAKRAQAHDFIMALPDGYETRLGERGTGLSGGEKQRISIARAMLKDAPILLLDEATAFADPQNEALVQQAIAELAAERTIIVIAHRLHTISHADEILVLDDGIIVERGSHDHLLSLDGLYSAMWQAAEQSLSGSSVPTDKHVDQAVKEGVN